MRPAAQHLAIGTACLFSLCGGAGCDIPCVLLGGRFCGVGGCEPLSPSAIEPEPTVSYSMDVIPVLETAGCLASTCHGGVLVSSGYSLASYAGTFGPGDQALALDACDVVPGDPDASYLIEKITSAEPAIGSRMPLGGVALDEDDIALIRTWIAEGAPDN